MMTIDKNLLPAFRAKGELPGPTRFAPGGESSSAVPLLNSDRKHTTDMTREELVAELDALMLCAPAERYPAIDYRIMALRLAIRRAV